jgi:hypothetical protein
MTKNGLKKAKRLAEEAWEKLQAARPGPDAIRRRYDELPKLILREESDLALATKREEVAFSQLTKPLEDYARKQLGWQRERYGKIEYASDNAQAAHLARSYARRTADYLERLKAEYAKGIDDKLADAEKRIRLAEDAFETAQKHLAQYAIFYARKRKDVDIVWTSEPEGEWTIYGNVAGYIGGEAKAAKIKDLIEYLLEVHSHRKQEDSTDELRKVEAKWAHGDEGGQPTEYTLFSKDLYKAMSGLKGGAIVDLNGCMISVKMLRAYLRLVDGPMTLKLGEAHDTGEDVGYREYMEIHSQPEGIRKSRSRWKSYSNGHYYPEAKIEIWNRHYDT